MRSRILVQNAFRFDRSQWRPLEALRCTAGLAVPVLLGVLAGQAPLGVLAATGALNAGLASYSGVTRSRLRLMLTTSVVTALVTVLGVLAAHEVWAATLAALVVGSLLALYGQSGPAALTVSLQATSVLVVMTGLQLPVSQALPAGLLVLGGALVQTVLLVAVWPASRRSPERRAVANVYRSLARYVEAWDEDASLPGVPDAVPLQNAWALLDEARGFAWRDEHAALVQSLQAAEEIRASLTGLGGASVAYRAQRPGRAARLASALARTLRRVESDVRQGHAGHASVRSRAELRGLRQRLAALDGGTPDERSERHWAELIVARLDRLLRLPPPSRPLPAPQGASSPPPAAGPDAAPVTLLGRLTGLLARMPRSVPLQQVAWRHALRFGVALALSTLLYRALNVSHGYWLPLTVAVLLRQEFSATLTRGVARLSGTLAGVLLAAGIVAALHPGAALLSLLSLLAAFLVYALFLTNYAVFSVAITLYVVFSVEAAGIAQRLAVETRVVATLLGGLLALAFHLVWPTWQARQAQGVLRDALARHLAYAEAVAALYAAGSGPEREQAAETARSARLAARQLRLQAENLVQAAALEPGRRPLRADLAALVGELSREAARTLALHAEALDGNPDEHRPAAPDVPWTHAPWTLTPDAVVLGARALLDRVPGSETAAAPTP
ncbi:FUSC family protein [Deinococcus aquiradiocola]|uniref:FUSC family protein n=1 Tax=Deinococcus aquiradiocola TaxID=393059 RepID=UPI0016648C33|nr:FUSC family protein [Deinococcus aquiradiocola]